MLVHNVMFKFLSKNVPELSLKQILGSDKFLVRKNLTYQKIPKLIRSKKMLVQKVRFKIIGLENFCSQNILVEEKFP